MKNRTRNLAAGTSIAVAAMAFGVITVIGFLFLTVSTTFWIAYAFTGLAYVSLAAVGVAGAVTEHDALPRTLPPATLAAAYALVQSAAGLVLAILQPAPAIALAVCFVTCMLFCAAFALLRVAGRAIASVDKSVATHSSFRAELAVQLMECEQYFGDGMDQTRARLRELQEAVRYSDPMGTDQTAEIEQEITSLVKTLGHPSGPEDDQEGAALCEHVTALLKRRNALCRATK